jgi:hypothetical protein
MDPSNEGKDPTTTTIEEITSDIIRASKKLWNPDDAKQSTGIPETATPEFGTALPSPSPDRKPKQVRKTMGRSARPKSRVNSPDTSSTESAGSMESAEALARQQTTSLAFRRIIREITLIPGESESDYFELAGHIEADLKPNTSTEFILVSRFTQIQWDLRRIRMWKDQLRRQRATDAFVVLMESQLQGLDRMARAARWRDGHPDEQTRKLMRKIGLTKIDVVAHGFAENLTLFETLEVMETRLEVRGHTILRELERHREAQGRYDRRLIEGTARELNQGGKR